MKAKALARRGELEPDERLARDAIAFVEQSDFLPFHAEALLDLAEILLLAGRAEEKPPVLEKAVRLWEEKGNVVAAEKTRAALAEHS